VLNLAAHRKHEQDEKVEHKDRPIHRDIKYRHKGSGKGEQDGLGCTKPKLELGQTADERPELVTIIGLGRVENVTHQASATTCSRGRRHRQTRRAILDVLRGKIGLIRGIKLGR
jgi:hypothetical protein